MAFRASKDFLQSASIPYKKDGPRLWKRSTSGLYFFDSYTSSFRLQRKEASMAEPVPGKLHVANDVLADMIGHAALECYGVVGMVAPNAADGFAKLLPPSRLRRGITLNTTDKGIHVDLYIVVEYGTNINAVSQNLVDTVTFVLKEQARVPVDGIDVHVQDVKVRR